jgi:hypothetical protein
MGKCVLNLAPGEPLALVQEFPFFENPIKLDHLLLSALNLSVPNLINGFLFHAVRFDIFRCQLIFDL